MKNIFKALFASALLLTVSCDDVEQVKFNQADGTFLSFSSTGYSFPIIIDQSGQMTVTLNSSTVSSVDRVYNIELIADESTASTANYTLPSTITIPANSYQGTMVIQGQDTPELGINPETIVFRISNITSESIDANNVTVNIFQVCPLGDDFTGQYTITQLTAGFPITGQPTMFGNGTVVTIEEGESVFERTFVATPYPALAGSFPPNLTMTFSLTCGETSFSNIIDVRNGCTSGNTIKWGRAAIQSLYNNTDDSTFQLSIAEDTTGSCASAPRQTIVRFTKL